jgi:hypothetical protein
MSLIDFNKLSEEFNLDDDDLRLDDNVTIEDVTVTVSPVFCAKKPTVTTAVADSPTNTASDAASITKVSALTAAFVGTADNVLIERAAAIPIAIFLNEFIFLLFLSAIF